METVKRLITFLFSFSLLLTSACSSGGKNKTLAENYDFGNPSTWTGEQVSVTDLGDCMLEGFSYDERYDWGQSILYDKDEDVYKMWWCRVSAYDAIWYAESKDLKNWTNIEKLIEVESNTTWIKLHVGKPAVLKVDGEYRMYFEAPATLNDGKEFDNSVFLATSNDGKNWSIQEKNGEPYPVLRLTDAQMADSWAKSQQAGGTGYGYYGIGQPSVTYKDGTFYLYCTYSVEQGDRMYVFRSTDGVHFDDGEEVFTRAACGVKYNTLTNRFMMAYEYTQGMNSRVYYMESADGVHFTYDNFTEAVNNPDVLSKGVGMVRGYPDFVSDGMGQVHDHTVYVSFMEGQMAEGGMDWRAYCNTWDIHIAAFNPAVYANRTHVLPNGRVYTEETVGVYKAKHIEYEDKLIGIAKTNAELVVDGVMDEAYANATVLETDRTSWLERAVPTTNKTAVRIVYTQNYLYIYAEVTDPTVQNGDKLYMMVDEKRFAATAEEIFNVEATREGVILTDGTGASVANAEGVVKQTENGYNVEIKMPWRYETAFEKYDTVGFDCFAYNNGESKYYKSVQAWNDYMLGYDVHNAGELYFMG